MKILLIGEGHGFDSLVRGFSNSFYEVSILDNQDKLAVKENKYKIEFALNQEIAKSYDLIISSGYRKLIPNKLLDVNKFLNIHYALFPKYRGMHSIVWAILNGEKEIGITVHAMDSRFDSGPIIWQRALSIEKKTSWQLMLECDAIIERNISEVISKYISGELKEKPQDHSIATYVGKRNLNDCKIDWNTWSATFFERALKALVPPYPFPFFEYLGEKFQITNARIIHLDYIEINGHLVYVNQNSILVKINGGLIEIFELANKSNESQPVKSFFAKTGLRFK
jgi:methionyl-tRNA formyltransferase